MEALFRAVGIAPQAAFSILLGVAVFASMLAFLLPGMKKNTLKTRMKAVALEREEIRARERARLSREDKGGRASLRTVEEHGFAAKVVEALNLRKALVDDKTTAKMKIAGYRNSRHLTLFLFARASLALAFLTLASVYIYGLGLLQDQVFSLTLLVVAGVAYLGFYLPVIVLNNAAQKRQKSVQIAWPDALDLMLICVEAGNSIEAAFRKVSEEIGVQSIPLAEELVLTCAELSYLPDRKQAYDNLAQRTGLDGVKAVTTALIQAERYGTPLGSALRTMAQENRDMRMNAAEKKAASLPPKLTVPMIVFFLPVLFAVILGPAIINIFGVM